MFTVATATRAPRYLKQYQEKHIAGNKQTEKPHISDSPLTGSIGITAVASTTATNHNKTSRWKTGGLAIVSRRCRPFSGVLFFNSTICRFNHLTPNWHTYCHLLGRRIIGALNMRSKFKSTALQSRRMMMCKVYRLFNMRQNPIKLIQGIVIDYQLPFTFCGVLDFNPCT